MYENLIDKRAILNVIGCLMKDSTLIDDIDRPLDRTDFDTEVLYELLYIAIFNSYMSGVKNIDEFVIDSYLSNYPEQYKIFQNNDGLKYLADAKELSSLDNYDYSYHRVRKYALLRYYNKKGLDTRFIFNPDAGVEEISQEMNKFDNYTEQDIVGMVETNLVINPTIKYCTNTLTTEVQAGKGGHELIRELMKAPDIGLPLNNIGLNTAFRGARKGSVYMRSCPVSGGKTRSAAGDACKMAVSYIWDKETQSWKYTGLSEPTVYITTEMQYDEIQTMLFATISKVDESHILYGQYKEGELERVDKAIEYIESAPFYIVHIPDFSIDDIKNIIKKYYREMHVECFYFDYIWSPAKAMAAAAQAAKMKIQEHQLLLMFITELKTIAQQLHIFIFTASQLSGKPQDALIKDQNLLAGAKALANKLDVGYISIEPNQREREKLEAIIQNHFGMRMPNIGHWIYKVRRGKLTKIIIWSYADFGVMDEEPLFVTDFHFNLIDMDFTQIEMVENKIQENSVLSSQVKDEPVIEKKPEPEEPVKKAAFDW